MRLLIVAPAFLPWDLGSYIRSVLRPLGWQVDCLAYQGLTGEPLAERLEERRDPLILGLNLDPVEPESLRIWKSRGQRLALWHVDCCSHQPGDALVRLLPHFDQVFTTARGMVASYQKLTSASVEWLVEGAHLPHFRLGLPATYSTRVYASEVAFVGNLIYNDHQGKACYQRIDLLERVRTAFSLKVWGPQGHPLAHQVWAQRAPLLEWPAYHEELVKICRSASVILGTNRTQQVEGYFSNRTFLTLASGGFHLTAYVPGLEQLFENHHHLVWFHDPDECLELLAYYLKRPETRQKIAHQGCQRVRRRFSLRRQVLRLARMLTQPHLQQVETPEAAPV